MRSAALLPLVLGCVVAAVIPGCVGIRGCGGRADEGWQCVGSFSCPAECISPALGGTSGYFCDNGHIRYTGPPRCEWPRPDAGPDTGPPMRDAPGVDAEILSDAPAASPDGTVDAADARTALDADTDADAPAADAAGS